MVPHDKVGLGLFDLTNTPIQITTWEAGAPAWSAYVTRLRGSSSMLPHQEWSQDVHEFHLPSNALAGASHSKSCFAYTRFNPACASGFRGGPLFWAQKALRRASGVWSLGGAGLIPE